MNPGPFLSTEPPFCLFTIYNAYLKNGWSDYVKTFDSTILFWSTLLINPPLGNGKLVNTPLGSLGAAGWHPKILGYYPKRDFTHALVNMVCISVVWSFPPKLGPQFRLWTSSPFVGFWYKVLLFLLSSCQIECPSTITYLPPYHLCCLAIGILLRLN